MTLYYSNVDDGRHEATEGRREVVESHAEYIEMRDDGSVSISIDRMDDDEKLPRLLDSVEAAIEDSAVYELDRNARTSWVPPKERGDE